MIIVDLTDIEMSRNGRKILNGTSWRVESGQHWAILGANGSGKTSLLKVVTGYEWPTDGVVRVLGAKFGECEIQKLRKRIGWVSSALLQRLPDNDVAIDVVASGLEASMGLYRQFTPEEYALARACLHRVGLAERAEQPYGTMSQGEQQRVLIARSLAPKPLLLILDEPCSGLDPAAREDFLADLARLSGEADAPSLVLVTHHVEEIGSWVSHVLVMENGRDLSKGPKDEVLHATVLAAAFGRPCSLTTEEGRYYLRLT